MIVKIPGSESPDQWIVRGNHHDGWVNGAEDPISGQIALLEEARALGELLKQGWKPKRTIIYCAWDGEEPMLLGSTEWAEYHGDELQQHAAIYINTDGNGRGFLEVQGSHSLEKFVNGVARDITDPEKNISVWKRSQAARLTQGRPEDRKDARTRPDLRIGRARLRQRLHGVHRPSGRGVAQRRLWRRRRWRHLSLHLRRLLLVHQFFRQRFCLWPRAGADRRHHGACALPMPMCCPMTSAILPTPSTNTLTSSRPCSRTSKSEIRDRNQDIDDGVYSAASDPRRPTVAPPKEEVPPFLNFAPLDNAQNALDRSAQRYSKAVKAFNGANASPQSLQALNAKLLQAERKLTNPDGLPRRSWYKHLIYAPGFYTGYGAKTLPGVREGIEEKRYQEAEKEIVRVAQALQDYAAVIDSAAADLEKAGH